MKEDLESLEGGILLREGLITNQCKSCLSCFAIKGICPLCNGEIEEIAFAEALEKWKTESKRMISSEYEQAVTLGTQLQKLVRDKSEWSQSTFGTDSERGPIGPLKHLKKECDETIANPTDKSEYADLLILLLDSSRRAGITPLQLIQAAIDKMNENRKRTWPKGKKDEVVEHVRDEL